MFDLRLTHHEIAPEGIGGGGGGYVVFPARRWVVGGLSLRRQWIGLVGLILVKLLLDMRLADGLDESAVLPRARVALVLGEQVVEVQFLFLHSLYL